MIDKQLNHFQKEQQNDESFNSSFESQTSFNTYEQKEGEELSFKMIKILNSISNILNELTIKNSKKQGNKIENDIFETSENPNISLLDYLTRIVEYSNCEENTLISALIYVDRIAKIKNITKLNVYKLIFTSILISLKYNEDGIYDNVYYSQIAGVSVQELFQMEYEYVLLLNFNFNINEFIFNQYKTALETI
jgi:hypothetical protein